MDNYLLCDTLVSEFWTAFGAIGQWFAALITLAVLLYAIWQDYWNKPNLLIEFDARSDIRSQPKSRLFKKDAGSMNSRWARIRVRNGNRLKSARNCRVFIIEIKNNETQEVCFSNDVRQLRWTHDHDQLPQGRDLLPGVVHWADVAATFDDRDFLSVCTFPDLRIEVSGSYRFKVQVSAEETKPRTLEFTLNWNGRWESLGGAH